MKERCKANKCNGKPCEKEAIFGDYCTIHYRSKLCVDKRTREEKLRGKYVI